MYFDVLLTLKGTGIKKKYGVVKWMESTVNGLSLWRKEKSALESITMYIPSKSVTALIGPSGCGKFFDTLLQSDERSYKR